MNPLFYPDCSGGKALCRVLTVVSANELICQVSVLQWPVNSWTSMIDSYV